MEDADRTDATGSPCAAPSAVITALTQAPLGIAIFDREMRYLAVSSRFLTDQDMPGDPALVLGRRHYDVFPNIPARWRELHALVLNDGQTRRHPADPFPQPGGAVEWVNWSMSPWRDQDGEIGGLVLYCEYVSASVEERLRLEAAEARYRAVFDQAAIGVARVSPDGLFLEVNGGLCATLGYAREELLSLTFQAITHPDDLAADVSRVQSMLEGRIETFTMEKRYLRKTGDLLWANLTVSLVRTADGAPDYFVSVVEDITPRKLAETQQARHRDQLRLMINELNHRVKNTLATVQSMAAQTLRHERDPDRAYGAFEARLIGLSEVHDVLTRENWNGAALHDVAMRALRPFSAAASGQIEVSGAPMRLTPSAALTLALVFHELATNAVKYGALSNDTGQVALTWRASPSGELRLEWRESNGPLVTPPTRKGFGTRLIHGAFKGELRGAVSLDYASEGLRCDMRAQLPANIEAFMPLPETRRSA
ncbi:sensor histidine kinase [Phenylobacterium immobile]|uniref:sensor histidine kinase n=1 Tax=Phenylobacterium immobile TaxID=21 RepID=UPI000A6A079A|nr:PAS domain S-box protein [Phenylobacterium immobile]